MAKSKAKIIIIPGLFKREGFITKLNDYCIKQNLDTEIFRIQWFEDDMYLKNEKKLIEMIKKDAKTYGRLFLIGTSAGGSVAINVFAKLKGMIEKVVCICSPLKEEGFTLALGERISDNFNNSLSSAIKSLNLLTNDQKQNILTFIPAYDELVPLTSMKFKGIRQRHVKTYEHLLTINKVINEETGSIASFFNLV